MATGGDFGHEEPDLDYLLDHDDDDDEEQEINRTQPFQPQPGATSTPYHGGEQMELQTMRDEQSGLPDTSFDETSDTTPLLGKRKVTTKELELRLQNLKRDKVTGLIDTTSIPDLDENPLSADDKEIEIQNARDYIKKNFDTVDFKKLGPIRFSTNTKKPMDIVVVGKKGGEHKIFLDNGKGFQKSFLNKTFVKNALGPKTEEMIAKDRARIREEKSRLKEEEKKLKQQEKANYQKEKEEKEVEVIRGKIEGTQAKIEAIGSNFEMEAERRRLQQLKKNLKTDLGNKEKELASLKKQVKNIDKEKSKFEIDSEKLAKKEQQVNSMQERLNQTKQLDDLKELESALQRKKEEDHAIIQDEKSSQSDKQAAEERMAETNDQIARLQTQIAEREREQPLLERVKDIFKKYGVTVASVLLAAGVTIGVVVSTVTNALKASTKALGKGLKEIGAKLGSLLPGLIGSVANFLFKAAGQAIGFLAEHTWLLILAVVAFLFEKYQKKRR